MKVLIADKFQAQYFTELENLDLKIIYKPKLSPTDLHDAIDDVYALVVRSTVVDETTIKKGNKLKLIIRAGAGVNTIDRDAAAANDVAVCNCPGKNSIAVAELAMGLILALDRHIPDCVQDLRSKIWNKATYSQADGIYGKSLGLVGLGQIGQQLAIRAAAFGMTIYAYDKILTGEVANKMGVARCESLTELAGLSDIVSIHLPLNSETKNLISSEFFAAMRQGSILINTARAAILDSNALQKAVESGKIRAGLDLFENEPSAKTGEILDPLASLKGVYGTHHIGASTTQAQNAVAEEVIRIIAHHVKTGVPLNKVN